MRHASTAEETHVMAKPTGKGGSVHATRNDLPSNAKTVSIGVLQACLLDAIDLGNATRQAHWTVRGPNFIAAHEMLGGFYGDLVTGADDIAERIVQLGGQPDGTSQAVAGGSRLSAYPAEIAAEQAHFTALAERYAAVGKALRAGIDTTNAAGDADTADLLTGQSRDLDKKLWFLEAHLAPGK
jgi:starvation-inducible DNA-binding protein